MVPLSTFPLPLLSNELPGGYGWEGRDVSVLSSTTAFNTSIDQRDIFLGKRRCVVCGESEAIVLQHCHIIKDSEIWSDLRSRGWIPSWAKELPRHEPRNALLMCHNHRAMFDTYVFFIRFIPDKQQFMFVNYANRPGLVKFHGKAIALDIKDRYAPFPSAFIIHEMRVRGFHPFQPTNPDVAGSDWQDWISWDGVFDHSSRSFKRNSPPKDELMTDDSLSTPSRLQFNPTTMGESGTSSSVRKVELNEDAIAAILAATRASASWKACQLEGTSWTGTAEDNIQKYFRVVNGQE